MPCCKKEFFNLLFAKLFTDGLENGKEIWYNEHIHREYMRFAAGADSGKEIPMSINIQAKTNVSYLFSSLGNGASGVAGSNFLADYASIKNGSYGKLMRAYYKETASDEVKSIAKNQTKTSNSTVLTKEESQKYAKVQTTSDALKESADALLDKKLYTGNDTDKIYEAVSSFVKDYNSVITAAGETDDTSVTRRVQNMENMTLGKTKSLSAVGITVKDDGTLALDKDTFAKADMSKVKSLFQENGSYGYQISAQASLVNYAADHVINRGSAYTKSGSYGMNFSNGNLFSTYF